MAATGEIEVFATAMTVLNKADDPPFELDEHAKVGEEVRLRYRYLDLRRRQVQHQPDHPPQDHQEHPRLLRRAGLPRHRDADPVQVDPRRRARLPGAQPRPPGRVLRPAAVPQIFKQLLMVGGYDRYMQIAKLLPRRRPARRPPARVHPGRLRDELRRDGRRHGRGRGHGPQGLEGLLDVEIGEIPRMDFAEAMLKYGSDKPDLRYGMEIVELTDWAPTSGFVVFQRGVENGGVCRGLNAKGACAKLSRRKLDTSTRSSCATSAPRAWPGSRSSRRRMAGPRGPQHHRRSARRLWPSASTSKTATSCSSAPTSRRSSRTPSARCASNSAPTCSADRAGPVGVPLGALGPDVRARRRRRPLRLGPPPVHRALPRRPRAAHHRPGRSAQPELRPGPQRRRTRWRLDPYPRPEVQAQVFDALGIGDEEAKREVRLPARRAATAPRPMAAWPSVSTAWSC